MNKKGIIALTLLAIGGLGFGEIGFSLLDFTFSPNYEAEEPIAPEDFAKNSDIENKNNGLDAFDDGDYYSALSYFMAISDSSETVDNKNELVSTATNAYLSEIISRSDEELDYENFNEAKNLLESAIRMLPESEELSQKYEHALLREELYKICGTEDAKQVLSFINENEVLSNDKYVVDLYKQEKERYLSELVSQIDNLIEQHDFDAAYAEIKQALNLIGECEEIRENAKRVGKEEVKHYLETLEENEQWREMLDYFAEHTEWKEEYWSIYNTAFSNYKNGIMKTISELLEGNDYQGIKNVVEDAVGVLSADEEFMQYYEKYKDYDSSRFCFCPLVNQEDIKVSKAYDIKGNAYSDVIQVEHGYYEKTLEFRIPSGYTQLQGILLICQSEQYKYDETDEGYSIVTFLDDNDNILEVYENITYKEPADFNVNVSGMEFLRMKISRTTSRSVVLGIGEAVLY